MVRSAATIPCSTLQRSFAGPTEESNWVIYGRLLVGAYPSSVNDVINNQILSSILQLGIKTFVCLQVCSANCPRAHLTSLTAKPCPLQAEYQHEGVREAEWRAGIKLRPYIFDAIRLVDDLPPSFFPSSSKPEGLEFVFFPIVDCAIANDSSVLQLAQDLCGRLMRGETMYVHCWGGHGRTGTVVSIMLGLLYGLAPLDAMRWVQFCHDLRITPMGVSSPQTEQQRQQVIRVLNTYRQRAGGGVTRPMLLSPQPLPASSKAGIQQPALASPVRATPPKAALSGSPGRSLAPPVSPKGMAAPTLLPSSPTSSTATTAVSPREEKAGTQPHTSSQQPQGSQPPLVAVPVKAVSRGASTASVPTPTPPRPASAKAQALPTTAAGRRPGTAAVPHVPSASSRFAATSRPSTAAASRLPEPSTGTGRKETGGGGLVRRPVSASLNNSSRPLGLSSTVGPSSKVLSKASGGGSSGAGTQFGSLGLRRPVIPPPATAGRSGSGGPSSRPSSSPVPAPSPTHSTSSQVELHTQAYGSPAAAPVLPAAPTAGREGLPMPHLSPRPSDTGAGEDNGQAGAAPPRPATQEQVEEGTGPKGGAGEPQAPPGDPARGTRSKGRAYAVAPFASSTATVLGLGPLLAPRTAAALARLEGGGSAGPASSTRPVLAPRSSLSPYAQPMSRGATTAATPRAAAGPVGGLSSPGSPGDGVMASAPRSSRAAGPTPLSAGGVIKPQPASSLALGDSPVARGTLQGGSGSEDASGVAPAMAAKPRVRVVVRQQPGGLPTALPVISATTGGSPAQAAVALSSTAASIASATAAALSAQQRSERITSSSPGRPVARLA